eukprot:301132-Rhodomonas_salina.4
MPLDAFDALSILPRLNPSRSFLDPHPPPTHSSPEASLESEFRCSDRGVREADMGGPWPGGSRLRVGS